jgi:hypothetical protein
MGKHVGTTCNDQMCKFSTSSTVYGMATVIFTTKRVSDITGGIQQEQQYGIEFRKGGIHTTSLSDFLHHCIKQLAM